MPLPESSDDFYDDKWNPAVRAYCYYEKEDGTQVVSPGASLNCPSDVAQRWRDNPGEFTPEDDGIIYDLTGRRVTGDKLAPGIYIRKGKKFIVGSN